MTTLEKYAQSHETLAVPVPPEKFLEAHYNTYKRLVDRSGGLMEAMSFEDWKNS